MQNDKKAVNLPENEKDDQPLPNAKTITKAQELARRVSPLALAMLEAKKDDRET